METLNQITYLKTEQKLVERKQNLSKLPFYLPIIQFGFKFFGAIFPKTMARIAFRLFCTPRSRAKHQISDEWMEKAKIFEVLYGKTMLKGYEWGQGSKIVLLVHGWESRGTALRSFVPELIAMGYRVVTFDGPAHGNSNGKRTNLPDFGKAIRAMINQIGPVHSIIAHSFGGASTAYALSQFEDSIELEKLVFIGVPENLSSIFNGYFKALHIPLRTQNAFIDIIEQKLGKKIDKVDISKLEDDIHFKEMLLVHDQQDKVVPLSGSEKIVSKWNKARLIISNGFGHYKIMKNPDLVKAVVSFINN